ncbi:cilia- and flagella-associated protein 65 isoform X3 [Halyomorpha halys]|uniref:cilia- and flagella-associated protein 65 isoform X3 n=1 Tax=Halyomorpha halys TaxID=286706 RepID=UPI0006D4D69E|nr:cilia- and flagella-associated protein 65 isoform X2 [Halyomorpha halys]
MENICHGPFPPDSITTEFPDCIPGNEYVKLLDWPYASKIVAIEREKTTDPREWMFEVTEEPPPAKGLRIIYKPVLPFTENYDYFYLKTATKDRITLNIKGSTVGPNVFFKTDHLVFDCKDCQATKKKIIMENKGLMDTLFCFDIDNCCSDVDICPRYGTIEMNGKIELMVTFHPTRASFTFRKIFCIVHYQEPIFITIRANYKKISAFTEFNDYIHFQVPFSEYPNKFEAYIQDVASVLFVEKPPLLSLDRRYIDFGMVDATKGGRIASEQFSITNNGDVKLCIIWLIGERSEFTIDPPKIEIEANERMSLWARFKPTFPDQLHSAKITAGIHWGTNNDFTVPFPLSVDLLAHTFTIMRTGWDPFFKCVDKVILPATIPSMPCFGTYRLMNTGRFPIIFKFIPPSVTNLTMKPLHGLIEGDSFQLFALRFLPGLKADIAYTEKWILEINFFQKMEVEFTTTAELPYLIFSNKEPVKFSHTSLHSDISISVPVKNNTRLKTSFNLAPQDTEIPFYIENPVTTVSPNELTHVTLHFNPHRYGKFESHMVFDMKCLTSLGQTHCSCIVVKVMGVCSRVTLKAMPSSLYLGEILMGCWLYGTFKIKNTGKCDALLDTIGMPRSHGDEDVITKVEPKAFIIPAMSKLNPKEEGIVTINCKYTDHSKKSFKFILSVTATQDEKIHGYTVLWVERVCGKPGKQYLDFNQPTSLTTTVMVKAYPVYVGDPCKPTQVIWTYNNFNEEISYKIENNDSDELQIFYFPHPEGIIAAHSAHPLVFNFNPYQYKTYTKTFNLVTPHVTYVLHMMGVGSIAPCYSTYAMQNKVPVISLFNDNQDEIEVSIDHLSLKPMLLHSTVKRMVFLKNKMNEPVEFCWAMRRFGAMFHVKAVPQDGVLEPNQLEPVQIIIQSLSIPSRLTIFITCKFVYLERLQSYKDKMENIRKFGKVFDCCFSMTEKNEFIPIDMSLGSGSKSFPTYFNVTLSLHSISERYLDDIMPNKKHQMKILSQAKIETKNNIRLALTRNEGAICIDVFTRVMWEILNRKIFLESVSNIKQTTYYRDIADAEKMMPLVEAPKTLVLNVLNTAIFKALLQMFAIDSEWTKDTSIIIPQQGDDNVLKTRGKMSNKYYGDILEHGFYHIVSLFIGSFNYERRYSDVAHLPKRIKFLKTLKD